MAETREPLGWEGDWPEYGITTASDLHKYLELRLAGMRLIGIQPLTPDSTRRQLDKSRKALRNALRVLDRLGVMDRPKPSPWRGNINRLTHNQLETRLSDLVRWLAQLDNHKPRAERHSESASGKSDAARPANLPTTDGSDGKAVKKKRSTQKGDAKAKLIAALTKHHKYQDGSCLNAEPIGVNELARLAGVSPGSASAFFNNTFAKPDETEGHKNYKIVCLNTGRLADSLKALNGDIAPHDLYGRAPPSEGHDEDG